MAFLSVEIAGQLYKTKIYTRIPLILEENRAGAVREPLNCLNESRNEKQRRAAVVSYQH